MSNPYSFLMDAEYESLSDESKVKMSKFFDAVDRRLDNIEDSLRKYIITIYGEETLKEWDRERLEE